MFLSPSQTPRFHFIIGSPPPVPSDFCFIMKKSLYKRFYTKIPNSATFDVKNGHYTVFLTNYFFRLAIPACSEPYLKVLIKSGLQPCRQFRSVVSLHFVITFIILCRPVYKNEKLHVFISQRFFLPFPHPFPLSQKTSPHLPGNSL